MNFMQLEVPEEISEDFIDQAKQHFPRETYGILLGTLDQNIVKVAELFVPEDVEKFCTTSQVNIQDNWFRQAKAKAKRLGMVVLGDVHSHPYQAFEMAARRPHAPDASPSEGDLERMKRGVIQGICLITESKNHKLRARLRFWGSIIPFTEKTV